MITLQELLIKAEAATDKSLHKYDLYKSILQEIDSKSIKNFINHENNNYRQLQDITQ